MDRRRGTAYYRITQQIGGIQMSINPEKAAARALFEKLASAVEEEIRLDGHGDAGLKSMTAFSASTTPYLKAENVMGVQVHHNGRGWIGDVILQNVPDSIPNVLGTPESMPRATYAEAENDAKGIVRLIILNSRGLVTVTNAVDVAADDRHFDLDGLVLTLSAEQVDLGQRLMATVGMTPDNVIELLRTKIAEDFKDKPDSEAFFALDERRQTVYVGFAAALLSQGVISLDPDRYRDAFPKPPSSVTVN